MELINGGVVIYDFVSFLLLRLAFSLSFCIFSRSADGVECRYFS